MLHKEIEYMNKTLTRKQIQAYGASKYQAQVITKELVSIDRYGRVHLYNLNDVVIAIRQYVQRSRIKQYTRETLNSVLLALLAKLGNIVEIPFEEGSDPQIRKLGIKLIHAMAKTDTSLANLKVDLAEINIKYGVL